MERQTAARRCSTDLRGESSAVACGVPEIDASREEYPVSTIRAAATYDASAKESTSAAGVATTSEGATSAQQTTTNR